LALASALLATSASLAVVAHADQVRRSPGTHRFATTDALVSVLDGPDDKHVTTIDTRLYVPDNATPRTPQPAVLMTHGFGLTKASPEVTSMATFLARHGYVVLTYTAQGFGGSSGCVSLQSRTYDVKDARQLITKVLQTKPYVKRDRKGAVVGTVGGSYGGGIQLNLAEADQRVRAIVPYRTWNSLQYSLDPNNWVVPGDPTGFSHDLAPQGVFKKNWTTLFFGSGMGQPVGGLPPTGEQNGSCPEEKLASPTEAPGVACTGFRLALCETFAKLSATGDADTTDKALVADSSGSTQISRLRVPTLLVQGQSDTIFNLNDAVATYTQLRRQRTPVQMIWNSGGHGGYTSAPGECEVFDGSFGGVAPTVLDDCYLPLRTLAFLDRWLRGKPDRSPGFSWYRDWAPQQGKGATTRYDGASAFPLPGALTFTLSGSSDLVPNGATTGSATIVNPPGGVPSAVTEISNFTGPNASPSFAQLPTSEVPGQHADFTSAPFTTDVDSVGVPSARLVLSHTAPTDLVLFGKVYDVAPDGTATLIHRLIAPYRIPGAALGKPVDVKLLGFAHRFAKGHRVRLTLATTDTTSFNNPVPDVVTITTGPGSTFTLPFRKA
jgi:ABC-2 type transport system ATP-binding protein